MSSKPSSPPLASKEKPHPRLPSLNPLSPRSLRTRLTFFFLGFLGLTLAGFSTILYQGFVSIEQDGFDAALYNYATDVSRSIDVNLFGRFTIDRDILFNEGKLSPFLIGESFVQVLDLNGQILARSPSLGSGRLPVYQEDIANVTRFQTSFRTVPGESIESIRRKTIPYRLITHPIDPESRADQVNYILQIGAPTTTLIRKKRNLLTFFLFAVPFTMIAVGLGGFFLAGRALSPVTAIIEKSKLMSPTRLSDRLPVPEVEDELRDLSLTLNGLLDRLQAAFESQERFIADASHQLKTPLAILRGELDVFRSRSRSPEELKEFAESASQELEHLSRMVGDLLVLARIDIGADTLQFEEIRLDEITVEAIARLEWLANQKGVKVRLNLTQSTSTQYSPSESPPSFDLKGDSDLVRTMIQNLIENAIKYSDTGKTVEVILDRKESSISFQVKNWGTVIDSTQISKIFDRFYQVSPSAQQENHPGKTQGMGLGLAIVKQIAEAHGGEVSVQSSEITGTCFEITLRA